MVGYVFGQNYEHKQVVYTSSKQLCISGSSTNVATGFWGLIYLVIHPQHKDGNGNRKYIGNRNNQLKNEMATRRLSKVQL